MRLLAGKDAADCGVVAPDQDKEPAAKCARDEALMKQAFMVRFDRRGIDAYASSGFAGNVSGDVYAVHFSSMPFSSPGRQPGAQLFDNGYDRVFLCPKPVRIFRLSSVAGKLLEISCVRPELPPRLKDKFKIGEE
jgi:hypothetical protein